jgi:hypothetical protein
MKDTANIDDVAVAEKTKKSVDEYFTGSDPFEIDWDSLIQAHTNLHTNDHADHNAS